MGTRTIVTSQPDVACEVCGRRLLRGELPEVFLAAGERRIVCELCAPRAANEGWLRESQDQPASPPPPRPRRRQLFGRLRLGARPHSAPPPAPTEPPLPEQEPPPYDFLAAAPAGDDVGPPEEDGSRGRRWRERTRAASAAVAAAPAEPAAARPEDRLERAIEAFNAGEYPRRVASLARSLGSPEVSVRADQDLAGLVEIVVAWELCWYRYQVDIDDETPEVSATAQGTDLEQLARADRLDNALAGERGQLSLTGAYG